MPLVGPIVICDTDITSRLDSYIVRWKQYQKIPVIGWANLSRGDLLRVSAPCASNCVGLEKRVVPVGVSSV